MDDLQQRIVDGLIDSLNRGVSTLDEMCDPALEIHSYLLHTDASKHGRLEALIAACRASFPDLTFSSDGITSSAGDLKISMSGRRREAVANIRCTLRVRLEKQRIRKLWLSIDRYAYLLQTGKILCDPGRSVGNCAELNQSAADWLTRLLATGDARGSPIHPGVVIHGRIKVYKDLSRGLDADLHLIEGAGKFDELLQRIHENFRGAIEMSLGTGISQGHTTTFMGTLRATVGGALQRYRIQAGFVSADNRLDACWINILPPPSARDLFT
jgi:hypothetical protein